MTIEVKVPLLPESVTEATVLAWHKEPGTRVRRGDNLVDLETDKVVLEVPAPEDGVLAKRLKDAGAVVHGQEVIALIEAGVAQAPAPQAAAVPLETHLPPSARRLAAEKELDTSKIAGTGPHGHVTRADVAAHMEAKPEPPAATPAAVKSEEPLPYGARPAVKGDRRERMSRLRATVARRLIEAQQTAAMLTTFNDVNLQALTDLRQKYREGFEKRHGVKLGFMSFFVQASVEALRRYPVLNARLEGEDIVYQEHYDVGIAVAAPRGLVVPVIRNAEGLSLAEIEKVIAAFAEKARTDMLSVDDLRGGTFTITNGGVFGSLLSTPILNPPQSAILGMHRIEPRPIAENGQVVIRPMMYLAVTYDHRLIDGADAVRFLGSIKASLEDPARLLLEL